MGVSQPLFVFKATVLNRQDGAIPFQGEPILHGPSACVSHHDWATSPIFPGILLCGKGLWLVRWWKTTIVETEGINPWNNLPNNLDFPSTCKRGLTLVLTLLKVMRQVTTLATSRRDFLDIPHLPTQQTRAYNLCLQAYEAKSASSSSAPCLEKNKSLR